VTTDSVGCGGATPLSTVVVYAPSVSSAAVSAPVAVTAAAGASGAAGSESTPGGTTGKLALPSVAGMAAVPASLAGSAGTAPESTGWRLTDDPSSVYRYLSSPGVDCGNLMSRPTDLCEPYELDAQGWWRWRARRQPGNPLITACLSAGDLACSHFDARTLCGPDVLADGTCGPSPHFERLCASDPQHLDLKCFSICLSCTEITEGRSREFCRPEGSGLPDGVNCPAL
jgi:hypothetical protein